MKKVSNCEKKNEKFFQNMKKKVKKCKNAKKCKNVKVKIFGKGFKFFKKKSNMFETN